MRASVFLSSAMMVALLCGPAIAQTGAGGGECADAADLDAFTPRITEHGNGAAAMSGCADTLSLTLDARAEAGVGVAPWGDLARRIDRLTLMPDAGGGRPPVVIVTGDSRTLILGTRQSFGGFSIGGYLAYPQSNDRAPSEAGSSYGLGAAYEGEDWSVGLAYRRIAPHALSSTQGPEGAEAIELTGQYEFGSGVNLQGSLGWAERAQVGNGAAGGEGDWYIVGTVKIPF